MATNPIPYSGTCSACQTACEVLVTPGQPGHPFPRLVADCPACGAAVELAPIAP